MLAKLGSDPILAGRMDLLYLLATKSTQNATAYPRRGSASVRLFPANGHL